MRNSETIISTPPEPAEAEVDLAEAEFERRVSTLGPEQHNRRLDQVLVELVPEFSRSYLQQLVDIGAVCVNGKPAAKAAQRVKMGDQTAVELRPTPQSQQTGRIGGAPGTWQLVGYVDEWVAGL